MRVSLYGFQRLISRLSDTSETILLIAMLSMSEKEALSPFDLPPFSFHCILKSRCGSEGTDADIYSHPLPNCEIWLFFPFLNLIFTLFLIYSSYFPFKFSFFGSLWLLTGFGAPMCVQDLTRQKKRGGYHNCDFAALSNWRQVDDQRLKHAVLSRTNMERWQE